ncbi:MAG: FRG domain-containing protein [Verrucomicrobiia bacterium]
MEFFEAKDVQAAVQLATKFQREGRYDWFRGQRQDWPLDPALARLADRPEELREAEKRLERFYLWLKKTPGLKELLRDPDAFCAVAQHYGIPTLYLDFTTDPGIAGFFAAENATRNAKARGCIYCLNSQELINDWNEIRECIKRLPELGLVKTDVPNLMRLEAQKGVFLHCPGNWERWSPSRPCRIYFPQTRRPSFPTRNHVYPNRKSQLELLLDQFFMADGFAGWEETVRKVIPEAHVFRIETPAKGYDPKFFVDGQLPIVRGWQQRTLRKWNIYVRESLKTTPRELVELDVKLRSDPATLREHVKYGVLRALQHDRELRKRVVRWVVRPETRLPQRFDRALDWLWNGLRLLPYTDDEIAEGIALCFALHRVGYGKRDCDAEENKRLASLCLADPQWVEMSSWEGSYSRGFVSSPDLLSAMRSDIRVWLRPKYKTYTNRAAYMLAVCFTPNHLFLYRKFAHLFATQIAATQVMNCDCRVAYFCPASLDKFGLP